MSAWYCARLGDPADAVHGGSNPLLDRGRVTDGLQLDTEPLSDRPSVKPGPEQQAAGQVEPGRCSATPSRASHSPALLCWDFGPAPFCQWRRLPCPS